MYQDIIAKYSESLQSIKTFSCDLSLFLYYIHAIKDI